MSLPKESETVMVNYSHPGRVTRTRQDPAPRSTVVLRKGDTIDLSTGKVTRYGAR